MPRSRWLVRTPRAHHGCCYCSLSSRRSGCVARGRTRAVLCQRRVDYARSCHRLKPGGAALEQTTIDDAVLAVEQDAERLLDIDRALDRLATIEFRLARAVECRFFAGLSEQETAEALGVSSAPSNATGSASAPRSAANSRRDDRIRSDRLPAPIGTATAAAAGIETTEPSNGDARCPPGRQGRCRPASSMSAPAPPEARLRARRSRRSG